MHTAHLVVMHRPGYEPDMSDWYGKLHIRSQCELQDYPPAG
ncbi:MAG: hypothetical protein R3E95_15775 [Thiolinea sp.]